ncbi:MAG: hypothetical protein QF886_09370, partial [Planctomycetota bacterium]|nr:hypothetical protein [Planctomycetota bacterium]
MSTELRFFNPTGPDRVAVISVEDATTPGMHLVRLARGKKSTFLSGGASYGPYREEDVPDRVAELEVQLVQEGFVPSGEHSLLEDLASDSASIRAGAARRMGWHGRSEYLEPLLKALESAGSDACTILDALGALGDPRAVDAIRPFAERKLLSRRRSAVEALIQIGDDKGLAAARERVLAAIPESVRDVIEALDEGEPGKENIVALSNAVKDVEAKRHGLICDFLYELCTPVCVGACRRVVRQMPFDQPFVWRYVKSIFKRSMLRRDYRTFGWLSHAIEG